MSMSPEDLPGSRACVGCHGLTFRSRGDGLCPRCAFNAESLIEQVELDALDRDLSLMTQFEAYYQARSERREGPPLVAAPAPTLPAARVRDAARPRRPFAGMEPFSLVDDARTHRDDVDAPRDFHRRRPA